MSFFDNAPPRRPSSPRPKQPQIVERPEWSQPPVGVLPAPSPRQFTILKSNDVAVIVDQFVVYPNGVKCTITVHTRQQRKDMFSTFLGWPNSRAETDPSASLRFGLQFPDGTRWNSIERSSPGRDLEVTGPVARIGSFGNSTGPWSTTLWIWPLPAPGTITLYAAWLGEGIDENSFEIETDELRALSSDAEALWTA